MKFRQFCAANRLVLIAFVLSTVWFLWQHSSGLSWDFSVYVLNARYWWGNGLFFSWATPPATPFLLGLLGGGLPVAEYLYIALVSALWLAACISLADSFGLDRRMVYILGLNPTVLVLGLRNGTELLSLALLTLFVAQYFGLQRAKGGLALAATVLTRYSNIFFAPLLLLTRNPRKLALGLAAAAAVVAPWLLYNWLAAGDPLLSFAEAVIGEVLRGEYIRTPASIWDLLFIGNFLLPLMAIGIVIRAKAGQPKAVMPFSCADVVMLLVLAIAALTYASLAIKSSRYAFALLLPAIYFSAAALKDIKAPREGLAAGMALLSATAVLAYTFIAPASVLQEPAGLYRTAAAELDSCGCSSNAWVYINYLGRACDIAPRAEQVSGVLDSGQRILLFTKDPEPDWQHNATFTESLPRLREGEGYVIFGRADRCAAPRVINMTEHERLNAWLATTGKELWQRCVLPLPQALCGPFMINDTI